MEYSIQELARLAGVTTRTLRWYDTINLLKPSRIAESGYRYYGTKEVDRLQDILFYRALGVELAQIKKCLDDPSFHRLTALRNHLAVLEARQIKLTLLIQSVQDTIKAEERNEMMADEKKFEALKQGVLEQNEKVYGEEARALYGNEAVEASKASILKLTAEQYHAWTALGKSILWHLEQAVGAKLSPKDQEGKEITKMHHRWLTFTGDIYDAAMHQGLVKLYLADQRFMAYYDRNVSGCTQFLHDAVLYWTEK